MGRLCGDVLRKSLNGDSRFERIVWCFESIDCILRKWLDGAGFEGFLEQKVPRTDEQRTDDGKPCQMDGAWKVAGHPDDGIHNDDFADSFRAADGVEKADGGPPVMDDKVELRQLKFIVDKGFQITDVFGETVVPILRFVRIAAADVIGGDGADVFLLRGVDKVAVHEGPRWIAVEHDDWEALADIEIVHPLIEGRPEPA